MATLNRRQAASGAIAGAIALSAMSCSWSDTDPTPGGTVPVSSPTAPAATAEPAPDEPSGPAYDGSLPAWWPEAKPAPTEGAWSEGYVFSSQPQTAAERTIHDDWPSLWEAGVRSVTTDTLLMDITDSGVEYSPGPLVQYIDGQRYEGTPTLPLAFIAGSGSPTEPPQEEIANLLAISRGEQEQDPTKGGYGFGLYSVSIRLGDEDDSNTISLHAWGRHPDGILGIIGADGNERQSVSSLAEAMAMVDYSTGYTGLRDAEVPEGHNRTLYPGEYIIGMDNEDGAFIYDPSTDSWVRSQTSD